MKTTAKKMSVFQLTSIVAANMLGAGIILLPSELAQVGTITIISWLVTCFGSLTLAYIFAQCGIFTTKEGGMGGYAEYSFGKTGHFMANYAYAVSLVIANVAIAISAVGYGAMLFDIEMTPIQVSLSTIVLLWVAALLNIGGNHHTGRISNVTIWGTLIPVLFIGMFGWFWFSSDMFISVWNPQQLPTFDAISEGIALTLWGFLGFESAAANADAVENPKRDVPIATFFGTLSVAVIYVFSTNIMAGIIPSEELMNSTAPFGLVFVHMFNDTVGRIVMASMAISSAGAILGWQFTLARVFKSCAEAGFFPKVFARVNSVDSPVRGIFILLGIESVLALMTTDETLNQQFAQLVNLAVATNIFPYLLCCISVNELLKVESAPEKLRKTVSIVSVIAFLYACYAVYACGFVPIVGSAVVVVLGYIAYQVAFNYRSRVVRALHLK